MVARPWVAKSVTGKTLHFDWCLSNDTNHQTVLSQLPKLLQTLSSTPTVRITVFPKVPQLTGDIIVILKETEPSRLFGGTFCCHPVTLLENIHRL